MSTRKRETSLTAATADKHDLYERAVQNVQAEIDFVDRTYKKRRGRAAVRLREDFCGTGNTSCEWVRRRADNVAFGLDIDQATLDWGGQRHVGRLKPHQQERVHLLNRDVLKPGDARHMDCILAMNFSYWVFHQRAVMKEYFRSVRRSLAPDGLFFLDFYGGSEAFLEIEEKRKLKGFTYVWEQDKFNPITGSVRCYIHFDFPDGTRMKRAFRYDWRVWTLPEMRDLLVEAGFGTVTVYWEGDDGNGGGNGVFRPTLRGDPCESFICYIVAEKGR
ncbi:MAG: class I SAM-dependent methyltransferase [Leptolyngbya sp. PLA3]|nr:MAG: class I SAM-dependent methyltransferase [Cyanobacteria bacterium CYA]MCE7968843.1 class I SAM-dependent methyltransferase [Leptolyngbya sp. PL-A3]